MMSVQADAISLTTNIAALPLVGERRAAQFRKVGIRCVADLLTHLPHRYEEEAEETSIADAGEIVGPEHGAQGSIAIRGEVVSARFSGRGTPRFEAIVEDGTGTVQVIWFNARWMRGKLHPGMTIRAWGKAKRYGDTLQLINPRWEDLSNAEAESVPPLRARLRPIYPASDDLYSTTIERVIDAILDPALRQIADHLPENYRVSRDLPELAEAYRMVHRPTELREVERGRRRLAFDELLLLQLGVMLKRRHRQAHLKSIPLKHNDAIHQHIIERFPFTLTAAQRKVVQEISADLQKATPMNRLLQGDVGAGKTVVALYAALMAVATNHQAAIMAPTELLAEQHYASITDMLAGSRVNITLLSGSMTASQRQAILNQLANGEIDVVVGTHALLTETVTFHGLAVAVIDEQHRFGVHQRATLRSKAGSSDLSPHVLVMTATPIPRTLSLSVFGDLDISTIEGRPPGRQTIITKHVQRNGADEVYRFVNERLIAGEQAYIVVPAIEDSGSGLASIHSLAEHLQNGPLTGRRIGIVHGRLKTEERQAVMHRFRNGEIDALLATTVIEVGVDVPNATIMVVEDADRFGLAQLHQLRGRVGRGERQSLCVLIADPATDDGRARIDALVKTDDGFEIAEKDLEIRGPGELFGARQAGVAPFRSAQLPRDTELLKLARADATKWIDENPMLEGERDALLRRRLLKAHGEALGLGDVA